MNDAARALAPGQEVELKYAVEDPEALRAWLDELEFPGIAAGTWRVRIDRDTYVDTQSRELSRSGYAARVRRRGGAFTFAIKSQADDSSAGEGGAEPASEPAGLVRRMELEGPANSRFDPAEWPESTARDLLVDLIGDQPLVALFEIRQRRAVRELRHEGGARAELSLDHAEVRRGRRRAGTFETLEVEARGEDAVADILRPITEALAASGLGAPEPRSKSDIAARLVSNFDDADAGKRAYAALPRAAGVTADDTLAEAGRKVLRLHLGRMLAMEPGTRSGSDAEDLHKMRVATRRMRAAWRVFDGAYEPSLQRRYVSELRTVAGALGAVRDLDVQLDGVAAYQEGLPEAGLAAMAPLIGSWRDQRENARRGLMDLLDSSEYARFVDDYRAFADEPDRGVRRPRPNEPNLVREAAGGRIWSAYEHVRAHDAALRWADADGLHALRIDGKRLRYTLECFREPLPRQPVDGLIATVVELQDLLGLHNDANVAATAARAFLVERGSRLPAATRQAIGHYIDSRTSDMAVLRRRVPPLWRRVIGRPFRRSLASAIASL
jgi:triphosphatase